MIINHTTTIFIAVAAAYLLGSVPFAYIFTRLLTGKDIRQLGSGNAGANNVMQEVGPRAAIPTALLDVGKGTMAIILAHWLLDIPLGEPNLFVLMAGMAAIAGHMWSVYLRFQGGNGLSATIGTLAVLLPRELLIVIGTLLLLKLFTRNLVLSANISLLLVPIYTWFFERDWLYVGFTIIVMIMLVLNFIPTARAAFARAGSKQNITNELLRRDRD